MKSLTVVLLTVLSMPRSASTAVDGDRHCRGSIMPTELVAAADALGLVPLDSFYCELPGYVGPPFLWGIDADKATEMSAVFWCGRLVDSDNSKWGYRLLFVTRDRPFGWLQVVDSITWSIPRGLSVLRDTSLDLRAFEYVGQNERHPPDTTITARVAIRNYYDAIAEIFVKFNGEWLVKFEGDW